MTWKHENGPDGLPIWEGVDSVVDPFLEVQQSRFGCNVVALFALLVWLGLIGWAATMAVLDGIVNSVFEVLKMSPISDLTGMTSVPALINGLFVVGGIIWIMRIYTRRKPDGLITRRWSLNATVDGLIYSAGPFSRPLDPFNVSAYGTSWSVELASITRVESGRTSEWQAGRVYEGGPGRQASPAAVPPHEYQTFLYMADGSRRVFLTVNIHREDAATLVHSVQSWLDAQRRQPPASPDTPSPTLGGFKV